MLELRVPMVALAAEVLCADGRTFVGRIFIPVSASHHGGPMRAEEWMNESATFFAFLQDHEEVPILINKEELLILSVSAEADPRDPATEADLPKRRVIVECRDRRITGELVIDMPPSRSRVLDYLNHSRKFLNLREGERVHLVQKARITRVLEVSE